MKETIIIKNENIEKSLEITFTSVNSYIYLNHENKVIEKYDFKGITSDNINEIKKLIILKNKKITFGEFKDNELKDIFLDSQNGIYNISFEIVIDI